MITTSTDEEADKPQQMTTQLPVNNRRVLAVIFSATSTFGGNITTDRTRHHPLFNSRRPGVPCRRCTHLECSSTLSVICTISYFLDDF